MYVFILSVSVFPQIKDNVSFHYLLRLMRLWAINFPSLSRQMMKKMETT